MEMIKKIADLKKSIKETEAMVEKLLINLSIQKKENENKEKQILFLKQELRVNIEKIDEIIKDYNGSS